MRPGLLLAALSCGCAAIHSADGTRIPVGSAAFPDYVESVFREQNRVAAALAFALEEPGLAPQQRQTLARLELTLLTVCAPLNELAVAQRDGGQLGLRASLRRARGAPLCEAATLDAAEALAALGRAVR